MIRRLLVTNPSGESLPLTLVEPETSGFIIRNIEGLGPAKSNVNIRENASKSGSIFNSSRTPSRNIVLALEFLASPTIEAARLRTYKYFPNESRVRIEITTDAGIFYIYGYVESNEPSIFSKEEGTVISILCPDPFFYTEDGIVTGDIESIVSDFQFPFENLGLTPTISLGERFFQTINFIIPFNGSVNVAPKLILNVVGGTVNNPRIYFYNENDPTIVENLKFLFTQSLPPLQDGDYLEIVCEVANKSVTRYDSENDRLINYIGAVTVDSSWPVLHPGDNLFSYDAQSGGAYIRFSYEYMLKYSGV